MRRADRGAERSGKQRQRAKRQRDRKRRRFLPPGHTRHDGQSMKKTRHILLSAAIGGAIALSRTTNQIVFGESVPFSQAVERRDVQSLLATTLSSDELSAIDAEIRERALFSARVSNRSEEHTS